PRGPARLSSAVRDGHRFDEGASMITVREATGRDVPAIREIFLATYGTDYSDARYYDESLLTRLVYSEGSLMLVAEDTTVGRVVGTASVEFGHSHRCDRRRSRGLEPSGPRRVDSVPSGHRASPLPQPGRGTRREAQAICRLVDLFA